jgi:hypothetical protein
MAKKAIANRLLRLKSLKDESINLSRLRRVSPLRNSLIQPLERPHVPARWSREGIPQGTRFCCRSPSLIESVLCICVYHSRCDLIRIRKNSPVGTSLIMVCSPVLGSLPVLAFQPLVFKVPNPGAPTAWLAGQEDRQPFAAASLRILTILSGNMFEGGREGYLAPLKSQCFDRRTHSGILA